MPENPPEGYHTLTPQTVVEDAQKTISFLVEVFEAEVDMVYENDGFVTHAELVIGDSRLMLASASEDFPAFPLLTTSTRRSPKPWRRGPLHCASRPISSTATERVG
jgi:hypothetical protein